MLISNLTSRRGATAILLALAGGMAACPGAHARAQPRECQRRGARTVAATPTIRVLRANNRYLAACWTATGRVTIIDRGLSCLPDICAVGPIVAAGNIVAFARNDRGRFGLEARIMVFDVRRRRWVSRRPNGTLSPSDLQACHVDPLKTITGIGDTTSLVVAANGATAWIAQALCQTTNPLEVHVADAAGERTLAAGSTIDPHSLAATATTVYWTAAGAPQSAPWQGAPQLSTR